MYRFKWTGNQFQVFAIAIAAAAFILLSGCSSTLPEGTCNTSADCPDDKPMCIDGACVGEVDPPVCVSDTECPDGYCNMLTGECIAGQRPCTGNQDCPEDFRCGPDGTCIPGGGAEDCETACDCEPDFICSEGACAAFDGGVACGGDDTCPCDHTCNFGTCEGCMNDAFCIGSSVGPKCATDDTAPVPEGYCYKECGADVGRDCPAGYLCDSERGGICVPSCAENADCEGGLICVGGKCEVCTDSQQCDQPQICSAQGLCIDPPSGCTQQVCETNLGLAYYCDAPSGQCLLGCTDHAAGSCAGHGLPQPKDCNPCPDGQTCDMGTRICSGGSGCTAADCDALDCGSWGMICDMVTCSCITDGEVVDPTGPGNPGDTCMTDNDCHGGTECFDGMPSFGIPGACAFTCTMDTMCMCESPYSCGFTQMLICSAGNKGKCSQ